MIVILKDGVKNTVGVFEMEPGFGIQSHVTYKETLYVLDYINHYKPTTVEYVEELLHSAPAVEDHMLNRIEGTYYAS